MRTYLIIVAISAIIIVGFVTSVSAGDPTVTVTGYEVKPSVLMPGEKGVVEVTLKNTATTSTETRIVQYSDGPRTITADKNPTIQSLFLQPNGITVLGGNNQFLGDIGPGQEIQLSFYIEAPTKPGIYFPEVWAGVKDAKNLRFPVPVNVDTQLEFSKRGYLTVKGEIPESIHPGDSVSGSLIITNEGQSRADEVKVDLGTIEEVIAPRGTGSFYAGSLDPGMSRSFDIELITERRELTGIKSMPVSLSYYTIEGEKTESDDFLDVMLKGEGEIGISSVETNPVRVINDENFDLIIRIENTGTGEARSLTAKLIMQDGQEFQAFVGRIKPGNDAPAVFLFNGMESGTYPADLDITFTDDWGEKKVNEKISFTVSKSSDEWVHVVLIGIIIGGGYLFYRNRKKKEQS